MEKQAASILKLYRGNVRHAADITYIEDESGRREIKTYKFYCGQEGYKCFSIPNFLFIPPTLDNVTCRRCRKILIEKGLDHEHQAASGENI